MRNRFTITVTDVTGARHFSLNRVVKKIALGAVFALAAVMLAGAGTILWLNREIRTLDQRRVQAQREYQDLRNERHRLLEAVAAKNTELKDASAELTQVNEQLGSIEILIGLKDADQDGGNIRARLDTAQQTAREKMLMLQQIPSGHPVPDRGITSGFGQRVHPVTGERAFHAGTDLRASRGTPVHATADGVVEWAAFHKRSGLGKLVILRHDFGFRTYFGHLSKIDVRPGDFVAKGDVIGRVGSTGLSSGPHLHYGVRYIYRKLDPEPFLTWSLENYDSLFAEEDGVKWDSLANAVTRRLNAVAGPQLSLRGADSTAN
ncbi:MAG: peptidoglycan DD-metalloendopeptidase family protein [Ectothiorhodospiraceae bacterium]